MQQAFFICDLDGDGRPVLDPAPESFVVLGELGGRAVVHALAAADPAGDPAYLGADYAAVWAANPDAAKAVLVIDHDGEALTLTAAEAAGVAYDLAQARPPHQWAGWPVACPE